MFKWMLKKAMIVLMISVMTLAATQLQDLAITSVYASGDLPNANGANGSESKPYIINEESDFSWVSSNKVSHFLQTADINLTGSWTPIGNNSTPFMGTYNGNGYKISNLTVNDGSLSYAAMFGYTNNAIIKNVILSDVSISGGQNVDSAYVAGIVGMNTNSSVIERCQIIGTSTITGATNEKTGGIVGANGATIRYCRNTATIQSGNYDSGSAPSTGGIAGMNYGTVEDCFNTGAVAAGNTGTAGGIVGFGYTNTVKRCYSIGNVSAGATNSCAGAIIGRIGSAENISDNYYLTGSAAYGIGDLDPNNNNSDANVPTNTGTTSASSDNLKLQGTYSNWTFGGSIWTFESGINGGYPILKQIPVLDVTAAAADITHISAESGGNVLEDGYGTVSHRGVEYGKATELLTQAAALSTGTGSYTVSLSGLIPDTQYYTRAYAANEVGTAYGEPVVFTTLPAAPQLSVSVVPGSVIGSTKAVITGAPASKFIVNITDSSVGYISTNDDAPAAGTNLIDAYSSGTDIIVGVSTGKYLQVYDVGIDGKVVKFYEVQLANQHIKRNALSLPINEGFENGGSIPENWGTEVLDTSTDGNMSWSYTGSDPDGVFICTPNSGAYMAGVRYYLAGEGASGRLSLNNDFELVEDIDYEFSFYMYHNTRVFDGGGGVFYGETDTIQPQISLDSGLTWSDLGDPILRTSTDGWVKHTLSLNDYTGNSTVRVGLLAISDWGYNAFIDDVEIKDLLEPAKDLTADTTNNGVDNDIEITFGADASFEEAVTGVSFNGTVLTETTDYEVSSGKITLKPSGGNDALQTPATGDVVITAAGYNNSSVSQTITAGEVATLTVTQQPVPGAESGDAFATQPILRLYDQYGNLCSDGPSATADVVAAAKAGTGMWTIGGTSTKAAIAGVATYDDLTCTLTSPGNGAITFTSTVTVDSNTFTIPINLAKVLSADSADNDVDNDIEITFEEDASFVGAISGVSFNGHALTANQYTVDTVNDNKVTLHPGNGDNTYLRTPSTGDVVITATGYNNSSVSQTITAGVAATLTVSQQPVPGAESGDVFAAQPIVRLYDQYGNLCSDGLSATADVVAADKAGTGMWTIGGTSTKTAIAGVATYDDLTCTLTSPGNGAITFTCGSITVDSSTFAIPMTSGRTLTADTTNNDVDNDIEITFESDAGFEGAITQVNFNDTALIVTTDYEVSSGKVILKPSGGNDALQTPSTGDVVITATGYNNSSVSQTITAGVAATLTVSQQPVPGAESGDVFAAQPIVRLYDQYGNLCSDGLSATADVEAAAKAGTGTWTIGGTSTKAAIAGVATYDDLTCTLTSPGNGAITFTCGSLTIDSHSFAISSLNSSITPTTAYFDRYDASEDYKDIMVIVTNNTNSFNSLIYGDEEIDSSNYDTVANAVYTDVSIKKEYLASFAAGYHQFTFDCSDGIDPELTMYITDTTPGILPAPAGLTAEAGNACVNLTWNSVPGATDYNIYKSETIYKSEISDFLDTVCASVYESVYYDATGLTNGITYYFSVSTINDGGESGISEAVSATPMTVPNAPTDVMATAGNGQAIVSFTEPTDNGGSPITEYIVTSNPGNITAEGAETSITVTGLTNGTTYTFTVRAFNAVGRGPSSEVSNEVTPRRPSSDSSDEDDNKITQPPPSESANTGVDIMVNGQVQDAGATTTTTLENQTVTTITVDDEIIQEMLNAEGDNATVSIPVNNNSDVVVGVLNGQTIKNMETKEAVLEIKTENVTYTIPASEINIDSVSAQIGEQAALKDIKISITIAEPPADTVKIIQDAANINSYQIVVKPIEFEITCTSGDKTVSVSKFNGYVERMVAIPEGADPSKITTGIVLNNDGTFSHVPTSIVVIDGKYYAKINSLTNSTYSVIWNPKTFKDVENHWAKNDVNDIGSRLVIDGVGNGDFEPDRDVTRAEFAAAVVKALGLMQPGTGKDAFRDVTKDAWYYDAVSIAYEYGIIGGYGNGSFGSTNKITREQAMTIIARAMKITGLKVEFKDNEAEKLFSGFEDAGNSAEYAKISMASCIKTGIVSGRDGNMLKPKDNITRAEVAVVVRRLLQKSGLI